MLPAGGTYFARITGADDTIQLYELALTATSILLGDYNQNGVVDAADYTVWRDTQGLSVTLGTGADGNFDGVITGADFTVWRSHFGQSSGSGAYVAESLRDSEMAVSERLPYHAAVPEPASWLLAAIGVLSLAPVNRGRRKGWAFRHFQSKPLC